MLRVFLLTQLCIFSIVGMKREFIQQQSVRHIMIQDRQYLVDPLVRSVSLLVMEHEDQFKQDSDLMEYGKLRLNETLEYISSNKNSSNDENTKGLTKNYKSHARQIMSKQKEAQCLIDCWNGILKQKCFKNIFIRHGIRNSYRYVANPIYNFLLYIANEDNKLQHPQILTFIALMLLRGASPDQEDHHHFTPLYALSRLKDQKCALLCTDLLYLWGTRFKIQTPLGNTPMHEAHYYDRHELMQRFKDFGMPKIDSKVFGKP